MYNPQLDTFIQVAEAGSFSKAAQALYITPTAVIKQMNLLEARLGLTLFRRTHHGLTLTRAGESLLADARHIVQYSQESVARAREAERGERRVIRVGVSLMTPNAVLAKLWPRVQRRCPGMAIQVVSFENTPNSAQRILPNLGKDIDVIAGVFDDAFLAERQCAGLELVREPICCAVSIEDELASLDRISLDDLHGRTLMLIRRGWNEDIDRLRDDVRDHHPQITVRDFPQYAPGVFNECADEGLVLASLELWESVHPMIKVIPATWDYAVSYGIIHAPHPSENVAEFLEAVRVERDAL